MEIEIVRMQAMQEVWYGAYKAPARSERGIYISSNFLASFGTEDDAKLFKQAKEAQWIAQNNLIEPTIDNPVY